MRAPAIRRRNFTSEKSMIWKPRSRTIHLSARVFSPFSGSSQSPAFAALRVQPALDTLNPDSPSVRPSGTGRKYARERPDSASMAKVAKLLRTCLARLRWQSPHGVVATGVSDPATMARAGAYLFGSGATLALIWLFLPVSGRVDTPAMLAMVGASYARSEERRVGKE